MHCTMTYDELDTYLEDYCRNRNIPGFYEYMCQGDRLGNIYEGVNSGKPYSITLVFASHQGYYEMQNNLIE